MTGEPNNPKPKPFIIHNQGDKIAGKKVISRTREESNNMWSSLSYIGLFAFINNRRINLPRRERLFVNRCYLQS